MEKKKGTLVLQAVLQMEFSQSHDAIEIQAFQGGRDISILIV
jgi:hypothetical protein